MRLVIDPVSECNRIGVDAISAAFLASVFTDVRGGGARPTAASTQAKQQRRKRTQAAQVATTPLAARGDKATVSRTGNQSF